MPLPDDKMHEILELKEHITAKIEGHEAELELLRKNLELFDSLLKQSSFTRASQIEAPPEQTEAETIPITRGGNGSVIANAYVTPNQVSIILNDDIGLEPEMPPFKSFFVDRIVEGMRRKDEAQVTEGKIPKDSAINLVINKNGPNIREILVTNYRQHERVKEIINTAGWSLSRMLEKAGR